MKALQHRMQPVAKVALVHGGVQLVGLAQAELALGKEAVGQWRRSEYAVDESCCTGSAWPTGKGRSVGRPARCGAGGRQHPGPRRLQLQEPAPGRWPAMAPRPHRRCATAHRPPGRARERCGRRLALQQISRGWGPRTWRWAWDDRARAPGAAHGRCSSLPGPRSVRRRLTVGHGPATVNASADWRRQVRRAGSSAPSPSG